MATALETFDFPIKYINEYLYSIISSYDDINMAQTETSIMPFFPAVTITDITQYYNNLSVTSSQDLPAVIYYDRMIRLRQSPFPIGKKEQVLYTIYGSPSNCLNIGNIIFQTLDREDYAAQDVNKWMMDNKTTLKAKGLPMKVFFRSFKVFQADESRDLVDLNTYRQASIHKYIVEFDYHLKDNPDFL